MSSAPGCADTVGLFISWVQTDDAMTLHWWMHWFWVTAQFLVILGNPVPSSTSDPRSQVQDRLSTETTTTTVATTTNEMSTTVDAEPVYRTGSPPRQSFRVAKAIGPLYPQTNTAVLLDRQATTLPSSLDRSSTTTGNLQPVTGLLVEQSVHMDDENNNGMESLDRTRGPVTKKDSKITWILATNKTVRSKYDQDDKSRTNSSTEDTSEDLTVLPLQEDLSRLRLVLNRTRGSSLSSSSSATGSVRTFNRSDDEAEIDDEFVEPQLLATAASVLEVGVSEPTRLSRARSAFPKDFQRDQVQEEHFPEYTGNTGDDNTVDGGSNARSAVDIAAITGSCLATVVLLSTMGSLGFIMYRRRYLNPPQTLNSDKCSNPDSSGYIDDSTIRDNSEEMYSLDNDSFLNSLEAMTIQNYWTDSVKHTKL